MPGRSRTARAATLDRRRRPGGLDAIAAHADRPPLVHRLAVEHAGWTQEGGGLRRSGDRRLRDDPDWLHEHSNHDRATDDVWHGADYDRGPRPRAEDQIGPGGLSRSIDSTAIAPDTEPERDRHQQAEREKASRRDGHPGTLWKHEVQQRNHQERQHAAAKLADQDPEQRCAGALVVIPFRRQPRLVERQQSRERQDDADQHHRWKSNDEKQQAVGFGEVDEVRRHRHDDRGHHEGTDQISSHEPSPEPPDPGASPGEHLKEMKERQAPDA